MHDPVLPALRHVNADSVIFRDHGELITVARFLSEVVSLAEGLPVATQVVNLCANRYRFSVGLIAAMMRHQITLLPASLAEKPIKDLADADPALYALTDEPVALSGIPLFPFPPTADRRAAPRIPAFRATQAAVVLFTSGSTGEALPHLRTWGALVGSTQAAAQKLDLSALAGASLTGTVPHQHSFGLESLIMLSLQHGFTLEATRPLFPADIVAQLATMARPRLLVTTPIHLRSLMDVRIKAPPLDQIICATAPLATDLALAAEQKLQAPLWEIYGCTEVGQIAVRRTVHTDRWTCLDGIELDARADEIWASGTIAAAPSPLGDVIELTADRTFLLKGRKADMINIAGKRSSLAYLNSQLNAIPGVEDGVFVLQERGPTPRLKAYVVAPSLDAAHINAALRQRVDAAFLPRSIDFVEALPRNMLGKLPLDALRAL